MGARENLQRLAEKKQQEIGTLHAELERAQIYLQALTDAMRVLPREASAADKGEQPSLRAGTALALAQKAIQKAGRPLHISELLKAMGRNDDKGGRVSLTGSLGAYVRRNEIFNRPAPNTFGLLELPVVSGNEYAEDIEDRQAELVDELPATFGG